MSNKILRMDYRNRSNRLKTDSRLEQDPYGIDVLCINCEQYFSSNSIEQHSEQCTSLTNSVMHLDNFHYLDQINYKMRKIVSRLEQVLQLNELSKQENSFIRLLIKYCQKITNSFHIQEDLTKQQSGRKSNPQTLQKIHNTKQRIAFLHSIILKSKCSQRIIFLSERAIQVLNSLEPDKKETQESESVINIRSSGVKLLSRLNHKLRHVKNQHNSSVQSPQLLSKQPTQEFNMYNTIDINTSLTAQNTPKGKTRRFFPLKIDQDPKLADKFKQQFFSKCLSIKQQLPPDSFAQSIPINYLYNKALTQKVPYEIWGQFIREELSIPTEVSIKKSNSERATPTGKRITKYIMKVDN